LSFIQKFGCNPIGIRFYSRLFLSHNLLKKGPSGKDRASGEELLKIIRINHQKINIRKRFDVT